MRLYLFGFLWLALLPVTTCADELRVDGVAILDHGIYDTRTDGQTIESEGTALGYIRTLSEARLATRTDTVCARLGVSFGLEYRVLGSPASQLVELDVVTRFPPQGMVNANGVRFDRNAYKWPVFIGMPNVRTFTFDEPWEMVPGEWVLEFHYQGRRLGAQSFMVMTVCPIT